MKNSLLGMHLPITWTNAYRNWSNVCGKCSRGCDCHSAQRHNDNRIAPPRTPTRKLSSLISVPIQEAGSYILQPYNYKTTKASICRKITERNKLSLAFQGWGGFREEMDYLNSFLQHRMANLQFDWLISVVNKSTYNDADAGCVRELEMNNGLRSRT